MRRCAGVPFAAFVGLLLVGVMVVLGSGAVAQTAKSHSHAHSKAAKKTTAKKTSSKEKKSTTREKKTSARTAAKTTRRGPHASASKRRAGSGKAASHRRHHTAPKATARSIKLTSAFHATEQLRPMAQQLTATRSPAAYRGVESYAHSHPGEGASAAYLALGHAYMLDHKYDDAANAYRQANRSGKALDDYADYLGAQASLQGGHGADAYALLDNFADRHPGSIFNSDAPVLLANAYLQQLNPQAALKALEPLEDTQQASHVGFRYVLGRAYQMSNDTARAAAVFRGIYLKEPLSFEAGQARTQLVAMGVPLTAAERKAHADQLFNAKQYSAASEEYHAIASNSAGLSASDLDVLKVYSAVCDMKLKHISRKQVEALPETTGDSAALKLYMLAELSRDEDDEAGHDALIAKMIQQFPKSRWLEEALYSGGNMYLLKHNAKQATYHYSTLVKMFPQSTYAPSAHWRAAWMNYRLRNYAEAARLMDEQIQMYPAGVEVSSALYWRARIYEDEEHNFGQAVNYYRTLATTYTNFYYANLARQRLKVLGDQPAVAPSPVLSAVPQLEVPELTGDLPENDIHLIKARLLANAALNEYIGPEIQASETSSEWGALAEAEIYASYGEYTRSVQSMKHSGISFYSLPVDQVPTLYWHLLFPQPYWPDLVSESKKNGLDPYFVASLIRQESEFNAGAVSRANAYGLMQLIPSVGKSMAKKQKIRHFKTTDLLNARTNLELGTMNLKQVLDRFGGQKEYALAAYNAGDSPVRRWMSSSDYKDIPEFVESIPYSETREYVQAILRNREMYRVLYPGS
ncbi:MAG TPA: transglycosylase SLT domain-containing protein [Edaphobacter sp.]|uniref:lytic transglycosylase domain-containing protein n=1 Tax=Edaphobacter sp. TaxID=1934404 RepID=UPI002C2892FE|nr:transglycosylase SLT domain-containing protein [Edaphobacter sp.]HUZ94279.1 transglycosylase SLT domain-containing protein [Edaphobacter sp.]